jgi:NAD(P)-dependent dehydrogenase (short-subunit alcohol dehydrogenase family)
MNLSSNNLPNNTAIVTGASRGFGRGISAALTAAGMDVIGVARAHQPLAELSQLLGDAFTPVTADATDATVAAEMIGKHRPAALVLNAGGLPPMGPIHELTWEQFSHNWHIDVAHAFAWTREALTAPLPPGSVVVLISSGAALHGSPMSGGYASAKAAIRFIGSYAAAESSRLGLDIRFVTLLPQLTPATELGLAGAAAYAKRQGVDLDDFTAGLEPILTPELVGQQVREVIAAPDGPAHTEFVVSGRGRQPVN